MKQVINKKAFPDTIRNIAWKGRAIRKGLLFAATCIGMMGLSEIDVQAHPDTPKNPMLGVSSPAPSKPKVLDFIENKGQWGHGIRYKAEIPDGVFFLTNEGFVYNFVSENDFKRFNEELEEGKPITPNGLHHHAYKVKFVGGNSAEKITNDGFEKRSYYNNYFIGNDSSKWKGHVGLYGKAKLGNIYDGIDAYVYSSISNDKVNLKYDFVVAPGANVSDIQLSFDGVSPKLNNDGALEIKTTVNKIVEQAPYCYQEINGHKVAVASKYVLKNEQLSFSFPNGYNQAYPLVIDPNLIFATYSGGISNAFYAHGTTYDTAGNTYASALAYGTGWPTTTGAYLTTYPNDNCVAINKYNSIGSSLLYSTYFGASGGSVEPNTIRVDADGNLVMAGSTQSANTPVTSGAFQPAIAGGNDIYVSKLSPDGSTLLASTFVGGGSNEACMIGLTTSYGGLGVATNARNPVEVAFDTMGNIWVTSNSTSIDFPTTTNAAQTALAGSADAVVFKLNGNLSSLLYSTYLGGIDWDGGIALEMDKNDNPIVGGMTRSINFPTTSGAYKQINSGGDDGFLARIDVLTGNLSEATYIGTSGDDDVERIALDPEGNIYVAGRSLTGNYPVSSGAWSSPNGSVYIQKVDSALSTAIKSTTVGVNDQTYIVVSAFMVDECGNMVIGIIKGNGAQTGLDLTSDAFQTTASPFYLAIISRNFTELLFGSYFGTTSDHYHPGVSRLDKNGVFYQSVCSTNGAFPVSPNAYCTIKANGSTNDCVTFKFQFPPTGVQAKLHLPFGERDTVCAPYTFHLNNQSTSPFGMIYTWDPGDGSPVVHTTDFTHTYDSAGTFNIVLNAHSDSACVQDDFDTFKLTVVKVDFPELTVSNDTLLCNLETSVKLWVNIANPTSYNSIQWHPAQGVISGGNQDTVMVDPTINTYYVTVIDSIPGLCGFASRDTVHIDFYPRILNINTSDTTVCKGTQVQVDAEASQGYTFSWTPNTGMNDTSVLNPIVTANQTETYTLTAHHPGCQDTAQTLTINVQDVPVVDLGEDFELCQWEEVALSANITPYRNDYVYEWSPSAGMSNPNGPNTHLTGDTSGWYYLNVETPIGCSGMDSVYVTVFPGNFGAVAEDTGFCQPNIAHLWASGGVSYKWTPSVGLSNDTVPNPIANPEATTRYTVYMEDVHGCKDTGDVLVEVFPSAVLNLPDSITVYPGESYHLQPGTNCVYFDWFPTNGVNSTSVSDPIFNPSVRTRYFVTAKTENGCELKDSMDVLVNGTVINVPNAFTPGSGANGTFKVDKRGIVKLKNFSVYNRWGNKIFTTNNIDEGWDGSFNGKPQPTGVYIYSVEATIDNGEEIVKRGNVTLIR